MNTHESTTSPLAGCGPMGEGTSGKVLKGNRDNFKIHVNFMKPTFVRSLRQDKAYDKK